MVEVDVVLHAERLDVEAEVLVVISLDVLDDILPERLADVVDVTCRPLDVIRHRKIALVLVVEGVEHGMFDLVA